MAEAPLIAASVFFASAETNYGYRVSPDGERLGWMAPVQGRLTVHVRDLDGTTTRAIDTHSRRGPSSFRWAADSRHVLFEQDGSVDLGDGLPRPPGRADLRRGPGQGVR